MHCRRFVNLVVDTFGPDRRRAYALHRIDVSGFFFNRGRAGATYADAKEEEDARLPPPAMTFFPTASDTIGNVDFLPLTGSKDDDVVALDHDGSALLYGAASGAVRILPSPAPHRHKGRISPIPLTAGDSLYVIERRPSGEPGCFEVLTHGIRPGGWALHDIPRQGARSPGWYWRSLPPPPFADASIAACAVVGGGSKLWMTEAQGGTTYSFDTDTVSGAWSKVGDWALPFHGRAEFVPEHRLWFALGSSGWENRVLCLCASDLTAAVTFRPPCSVWEWYGLAPPSDQWHPAQESYFVPLGSGRFCVARFFEEHDALQRCTVLTGVEVISKEDGRPGLRMHRSKRYTFHDNAFRIRYSRVF